jgi:hypothetical protein
MGTRVEQAFTLTVAEGGGGGDNIYSIGLSKLVGIGDGVDSITATVYGGTPGTTVHLVVLFSEVAGSPGVFDANGKAAFALTRTLPGILHSSTDQATASVGGETVASSLWFTWYETGTPDPQTSTITIDSPTITLDPADGTDVNVIMHDANDEASADKSVTLAITVVESNPPGLATSNGILLVLPIGSVMGEPATTNVEGLARFHVFGQNATSSTVPAGFLSATFAIQAVCNDVTVGTVTLQVVNTSVGDGPFEPDPDTAVALADRTKAIADGEEAVTIRVIKGDASDGTADITPASAVLNSLGEATFTAVASVINSVIFTASIDAVAFASSATVQFVGPATPSLGDSSLVAVLGLDGTITVTATLLNASGDPCDGQEATLSLTAAEGVPTDWVSYAEGALTTTTTVEGVAEFTLQSRGMEATINFEVFCKDVAIGPVSLDLNNAEVVPTDYSGTGNIFVDRTAMAVGEHVFIRIFYDAAPGTVVSCESTEASVVDIAIANQSHPEDIPADSEFVGSASQALNADQCAYFVARPIVSGASAGMTTQFAAVVDDETKATSDTITILPRYTPSLTHSTLRILRVLTDADSVITDGDIESGYVQMSVEVTIKDASGDPLAAQIVRLAAFGSGAFTGIPFYGTIPGHPFDEPATRFFLVTDERLTDVNGQASFYASSGDSGQPYEVSIEAICNDVAIGPVTLRVTP